MRKDKTKLVSVEDAWLTDNRLDVGDIWPEEEGLFTFEDVAKTISDKMVRRHPHVFGDMKFATEEELHAAWAEIKRKEKEGKEWQADYLPGALKEAEELIQKARERKGV